ncbi:acetyl-CoA carboxylase, carboxyltransferase subunit beta [Roseibium aestuarii]|uniref:Acetyl-coenzyme A carboxylase carboxyl transferase subunit beta n=1 Tax=Roseibium aestuarii TaxID=2600299 RepID=A0ABW4JZ75_9HYPH|nr:acetyl-CoA carboxylase, carboxyltransferase subunit beta [Roseibium aestuarii]
MNWINSLVRPKIRDLLKKREVPENLWIKCPETGEMVFHRDLEANLWVVPNSGHHMRMPARKRLEAFYDGGVYDRVATPEVVADPLKFRDSKRYVDRIKEYRAKTGEDDAVHVAKGKVNGQVITSAVQDFDFMGGSLGMAAGEAILKGMETAVANRTPFVMFTASGGARMQEGILSLMQMPRTTVGVQMLREEGLPYIVVLTNPTTGGVSASYAMLGDVHIAEPGAQIGFAGRRVVEQTIREKLPDDFQSAEYLLEHGMVDMVVHRHEMKDTISRLCSILMKQERATAAQAASAVAAAGAAAPATA